MREGNEKCLQDFSRINPNGRKLFGKRRLRQVNVKMDL
jgi:hypothetical protein